MSSADAPITDPVEAPVIAPQGELEIEGRFVEASNATFLARDETGRQFVHKPVVGERPLWDFPDGTLANREVAAFALSRTAGFDLVPDTTLGTGPLGPAMSQVWLGDAEHDLTDLVPDDELPAGWFGVFEAVDRYDDPVTLVHSNHPALRSMALFDAVTNNADRKGSHILHLAAEGQVFGCDHGLTFHVEPKLRTVLWGWKGDSFTPDEVTLLERVIDVVDDTLSDLLDPPEVAATKGRAQGLLRRGRFPRPPSGWPAIPWPPL